MSFTKSVRIFFLYSILLLNMSSCAYFEKKEASNLVVKFMNAYKMNDGEIMSQIYPSLFNNTPDNLYKTDRFTIENIEYVDEYNINVEVTNIYTNPFGKIFETKMKFVVGKDSISSFERELLKNSVSMNSIFAEEIDKENKCVPDRMVIYDSYNFVNMDENLGYKVGRAVFTSLNHKTDCEKLSLAFSGNNHVNMQAKDILDDLNKCFEVTSNISVDWGIWSGNIIVKNTSKLTFRNVKYKLYGLSNNKRYFITDGYVCYDEIRPNEYKKAVIYSQGEFHYNYGFQLELDEDDVKNAIIAYYVSQ